MNKEPEVRTSDVAWLCSMCPRTVAEPFPKAVTFVRITDAIAFALCLDHHKWLKAGMDIAWTMLPSPTGCDVCDCTAYQPKSEKKSPEHWPVCMCGHIAQDHRGPS